MQAVAQLGYQTVPAHDARAQEMRRKDARNRHRFSKII
jgi:hypothetical protein